MSNIGRMRERIRIDRLSRTRRLDGGYDTAPVTFAQFWAHVKPVQANENEQAGRKRGAVTYLIEANRVDGLTTDDKVTWLTRGNAALNIREIRLPATRPLFMEIVAESGVVQ